MNSKKRICVGRGHRDDLDCITAIINKKLTYLGMLGSKKKITTIFNELRHRGAEQSFLEAIRTPIGLSINSQTPAEIAVSIAAEMIALRRGNQKQVNAQAQIQ